MLQLLGKAKPVRPRSKRSRRDYATMKKSRLAPNLLGRKPRQNGFRNQTRHPQPGPGRGRAGVSVPELMMSSRQLLVRRFALRGTLYLLT